jgi:DNA-binding transcriptional ArsR family regulator
MQEESNQSPNMDAKIQTALSHPKRAEIFGRLTQKKDGTREEELAEEFDMGIRLVEYHLKVLHDADLIARLDERESGDAGHSYVAASSL